MPRESHRTERVAELLLRELAQLLKTEIQDPRVKTVTLTAAKMSVDLRHARIYFTTLNDADGEKAGKALNKASGFLRRQISHSMNLRVLPEINFVYDHSLERAQHLMQVIDQAIAADEKAHQNNADTKQDDNEKK